MSADPPSDVLESSSDSISSSPSSSDSPENEIGNAPSPSPHSTQTENPLDISCPDDVEKFDDLLLIPSIPTDDPPNGEDTNPAPVVEDSETNSKSIVPADVAELFENAKWPSLAFADMFYDSLVSSPLILFPTATSRTIVDHSIKRRQELSSEFIAAKLRREPESVSVVEIEK